MGRKRVARFISWVLDPMVVILVVTGLVLLWAGGHNLPVRHMIVIWLVDTVPVVLVALGVIQRRGWRDWDIHSRHWRMPILSTALAMQAVGVWLALSWDLQTLASILTGLWTVTGVYWLLTIRWRVSIHVGIMATVASLAVLAGGWAWGWSFLFVPLVAWARVVGHDHTVSQTLAGALVPPATLLLTLWLIA